MKLLDLLNLIDPDECVCVRDGEDKYIVCQHNFWYWRSPILDRLVKRVYTNSTWDIVIELKGNL